MTTSTTAAQPLDLDKLEALARKHKDIPGQREAAEAYRAAANPATILDLIAQARTARLDTTASASIDTPEFQTLLCTYCRGLREDDRKALVTHIDSRAAHPAQTGVADERALHVIKELNRISMSLAADLVKGAAYTFQGHDYLDRNFVCERVVQWRQEWDATAPNRAALIEIARASLAPVASTNVSAPASQVAAQQAAAKERLVSDGKGGWVPAEFVEEVRAAYENAAQIADAELLNTNAMMTMPPKSSAAWNIANAIRSLAKEAAIQAPSHQGESK